MNDIKKPNDPNNPLNNVNGQGYGGQDWQYPDGRQLSYTALQNMCVEGADGNVRYFTPGDMRDIMDDIRYNSNRTVNGGNIQKLGGMLSQQGEQQSDQILQQKQQEEQKRQEDARQQDQKRQEQQRMDQQAAEKKQQEEAAWAAKHRPQEDAANRGIMMLPMMLAGALGFGGGLGGGLMRGGLGGLSEGLGGLGGGLGGLAQMSGFKQIMSMIASIFEPYKNGAGGNMMVATNGNGGLLADFRQALGVTPQGGDMLLAGPDQTQAFTPGQTPEPTTAPGAQPQQNLQQTQQQTMQQIPTLNMGPMTA